MKVLGVAQVAALQMSVIGIPLVKAVEVDTALVEWPLTEAGASRCANWYARRMHCPNHLDSLWDETGAPWRGCP